MNTSATCRNPVNVDLDNIAPWKHFLQLAFGRCIGSRIAELWGNHSAIADIKIEVARSEVVVCKFLSYSKLSVREENKKMNRTAFVVAG